MNHLIFVPPKNESSQIHSLSHDASVSKLYVRFHGGNTYEYENVPVGVFEQIRDAESAGGTFNTLVKKHPAQYPYRKL